MVRVKPKAKAEKTSGNIRIPNKEIKIKINKNFKL